MERSKIYRTDFRLKQDIRFRDADFVDCAFEGDVKITFENCRFEACAFSGVTLEGTADLVHCTVIR